MASPSVANHGELARAKLSFDSFDKLILIRHQRISNTLRQRSVPLEDVIITEFRRLWRSSFHAWRALWHSGIEGFLEAVLQRFHDVVVGRLITEVHAQNSLEAFKEIRRYHIKKLTCVVLFKTLLNVILKGHILPFELLLKVRPG